MINQINSYYNVQNVKYPSFRQKDGNKVANNTNPIQEKRLVGQDILANYAKAFINRKELKPVQLLKVPKDINQIFGEKIYRSDGSLHSIISKDKKQETIYYINSNNTIPKIRVLDNSGNLILKQDNIYKDETYSTYCGYNITSYDKNGKSTSTSYNEDGTIDTITQEICDNENESICLTNAYENNKLVNQKDTYWDKKNGYTYNKHTNLNINQEPNEIIDEVIEHKTQSSAAIQTRFANNKQFYVKQSENINNYIENDIGKEALNDIDLKPAEKFAPSFNPKTCDGEKTYFSNGAIESNSFEYNGEKIVCYFEPDGNLTYVETPTKKIEIDSYNEIGNVEQQIKETFSDGSVKTTTYDDQMDSYSVVYEDENETKSIQIYDGKVSDISNNTGNYSYVNGNLYKFEPNI